ncbi:MAG: DUF2157 domain-containing protein, partial [Gammaproteobacteria bacterium]|nr:DUF2157 domain-containing protein [Gammaproteobacteria bacterium]
MRLLRLLKRDLHNETREWVKDDVISENQAERICDRYGIDYHDQSQHSFGYYVLLALGYLFIGLSVIVLIGENWDDIPRAARMGSLIGLTLLCNGIGLNAWRQDKVDVSILWFFLGGLMYGASIMLIAQIYHIGEHFPDGIFWWALGVLPVALLLRSNLIMALAITLAFTWFFVEAGLGFYPLLFPLFLLALAWQNLFIKPGIILFLALIAGTGLFIEYTLAWHIGVYLKFDFGPENIAIGMALFLLFHGLADWLGQRAEHQLSEYGIVLKLWTLRFSILGLFIFSFEDPWRELLTEPWTASGLILTVSVLFSILAIGLAFMAHHSFLKSASTLAFAVIYLTGLISVMNLDEEYSTSLQ